MPDHISDMFKSTLICDWLDSIFSNDKKMGKSTTFIALFIRSSLPPDTKIIRQRIYFRANTTEIDNQYEIYSRTCAYGSSIIEGVDFTVSYSPVSVIHYL